MFKKLLKIALAVIVTGALAFILKDRIVFGKMAFVKSAAHGGEDDENEKTGITGAMAFWSMRAANPATGVVDTDAVYAAYAQANAQAAGKYGIGSNLVWSEMGPDNVGGRCRAIIVDKDSNNVLYGGGVTGGVFKSYDGGSSWKKVGNNPVQNENVVSMCQGADGAIYYGTGENGFLIPNSVKGAGFSAPGYFGQGVFKSTDHGNTFTLLTATGTKANGWTDVSFMAADPTDPNRIYAGNDATLMLTKDGGSTWNPIGGGLPVSGVLCKDIRLSKDGNTIYVIIAYGQSPGGTYQIWRSEDKGSTFTRIATKTVPAAASSMMLAIAPSHESTIYVSVANPQSSNFSFNGVYRSDDKGDTWSPVVVADNGGIFNPFAAQGFYDNCIAVDPTNYNKVYYAGLNMFSSELVNGSVQTNQLTDWSNDVYQTYVNPSYIHADQHIIIFDRTSPYPCMYIGTDGGISKSTNVCNPNVTLTTSPATSFFDADYGFNTTQFYGVGVGADNPNDVIAGAQDNGEISVKKTGITELDGASIDGGDAGYTEISTLNPNTYVEEYVEGSMSRSFDAGNTWSKFFDGNIVPPSGNYYTFMSFFSMWESANDPTSVDSVVFVDGKISYKAGQTISVESPNGVTFNHVLTANLPAKTQLKVQDPTQSKFYVAVNGGIWMTRQILNRSVSTCEFFQIASIPGFTPMCIRSSADGNTIFAAGFNGSTGQLYRVTGLRGKIYKYNSKGKFYPDSIGISTTQMYSASAQLGLGVAVDENDDNHVLFCTGTYDGSNSHIFASTDAMDTSSKPVFTNISNNMPSMPVLDVLINSHNPKMYLAATTLGVYSSLNSGQTWQEENNGMERVPVSMLRQQKFSSKPWDGPYIYAATFGRGVFVTSTLTTGVDPQGNGSGMQADKLKVSLYPNPVQTIENINVTLTSVSSVTVTVYNLQGRLMQTYQYDHQPSGQNVYNINTTTLEQGTYFVRVNAGEVEQTQKMLVLH